MPARPDDAAAITDGVHLWCASSAQQGWAAQHLSMLSPHERAALARLPHNSPRAATYVLGRALRRHAVSTLTASSPHAWTFDPDTWGRPCARGPGAAPPDVSLAHTADTVVVAVRLPGAGRVGVDVEPAMRLHAHSQRTARLMANICTPQERAALEALDVTARGQALVQIWALKEAALKALGVGLRGPWRAVSTAVPLGAMGQSLVRWATKPLDMTTLYGPTAFVLRNALVRAPAGHLTVGLAVEGGLVVPVQWHALTPP